MRVVQCKQTIIECIKDKLYGILISIINHELDKLCTLFSVNKLSLNVSKTNDMVFGRRKINCDVDIKINSSQITRVNKTTYLGIMIDEQLNWKEQIHPSTDRSD